YPHVYFPAYSCGLKDIARYLGCTWSEPDASGLQSVTWRTAWEKNRDDSMKAKLIGYNAEDCRALKAVVEFLDRIPQGETGEGTGAAVPEVIRTEELKTDAGRAHRFGKKESTLPGFDFVNRCAYFDYQRDKVFVRTNGRLRAINKRKKARG